MMERQQFATPGSRGFCSKITGEVSPGREVSWAKVEHSLRAEADEAGLRSDTFSHGSGEEKTSQYMPEPKVCTDVKPPLVVTRKVRELLTRYLCAGEGLTDGEKHSVGMYCSTCSTNNDGHPSYSYQPTNDGHPSYSYQPTRPTRQGPAVSLTRRSSSSISCVRDSVPPLPPVVEDPEQVDDLGPRTANAMCLNSVTASNPNCSSNPSVRPRASSETPVKMAPVPVINRASSIGPTVGLQKKHSFRDAGIYECNYESIDAYSCESSDSNQAILKLASAVKSIDRVLAKEPSAGVRSGKCSKVQYDSITVLPTRAVTETPPPPPPLPRTRSFKDRARTVHPWVSQLHAATGRASSAPPISPMHQRKLLFSDR